jgi:membrane fusion protein, multidrug efflux system
MNIRIPDTLTTMPSAVQTLPERLRRSSSRTRLIVGIAAAAVVVFLAYRFFGGPAATPKPPAAPVMVSIIATADVPVVEHTIGTVVSNATVQVTARVNGQLLKAYFKEGQMVRAGDPLFQIDPRPYQATYDNAVASLTAAKAKAERFARLRQQKAIAPQDADDARAAYLEAQATAQAARLNLDYTTIKSPIDGKTGPIMIQPGNQITASAGASNGTTGASAITLVVISQLQPIKVSFALPQADLPRIQARQMAHNLSVDVDNHSTAAAPLSAPVDFVSNAVNGATGTIELRATFPNSDNTLVPGQLVDVGVKLDLLKHTLVVPHDAVNVGPQGRYVYVVRDGNAQLVNVNVLNDDGKLAAISGRLRPREQVVTDGQLRIVPGKPVSIVGRRSGTVRQ